MRSDLGNHVRQGILEEVKIHVTLPPIHILMVQGLGGP
jgi:hypothetical protein